MRGEYCGLLIEMESLECSLNLYRRDSFYECFLFLRMLESIA